MDLNSVAIEFLCPLCHLLPIDSVLVDDGFIYCQGCIDEIFSTPSSSTTAQSQVPSPMTGELLEKRTIRSDLVKATILDLAARKELQDQGILGAWAAEKQRKATGDDISDTTRKAKEGDAERMVTLARWCLFGAHDGVERDATKGYQWCKRASDQDDMEGKAYEGYCLIRGVGVDRDWEDGYELLIEAASQQSSAGGRNTAAYVLAGCYRRGMYGFKRDAKKATKWSGKVLVPPPDEKAFFEEDPPQNCFGSVDVKKKQIDEPAKVKNAQLSGSSLLFAKGVPAADAYLHELLPHVPHRPNEKYPRIQAIGDIYHDAEHCSISSVPSASNTSCSTCTFSAGCSAQGDDSFVWTDRLKYQTCSKCKQPYSSVSNGRSDLLSTLCPECKTVGR